MLVDKIKEKILSTPSLGKVRNLLLQEGEVNIKGVFGSLKSILLVNLFEQYSSQILYVHPDLEEAETVKEDVELFLGPERVRFISATQLHQLGWHYSNQWQKASQQFALESLAEGKDMILIAHAPSLLWKLPYSNNFRKQKLSVNVGEDLDFQQTIRRLAELGFAREELVESPGEMSVRGGIIDVFPYSNEYPIRIEFWGDRVESLREFDPLTQRSKRQIEHIHVYPQELDEDIAEESLKNHTLLDYLKNEAVVVLDEPELIRKNIDPNLVELKHDYYEGFDYQAKSTNESIWTRLTEKIDKFRKVSFVSFGATNANLIDLKARNQEVFRGNFKQFKGTIERLNREKLNGHKQPPTILFLCDNQNQAFRLDEIFAEEGISVPNLTIGTLGLHRGFIFPEGNLAIFTDHQFFGRTKRLRLPRRIHRGLSTRQLKSLNIGDYVVHVDFGIGVFKGLEKITIRRHERECIHLEYRDGDKVYVPIERMDRVHKYSAKEGMKPALSKLGAPNWQRLKNKTKKKIKDIAQELIDIYAKRKAQAGHAFSEDALWQRELEASFPYEDTPDQIRATIEVKQDMESSRPMDRLVCGDVGYGKTEVAVRAAFKAVMSGKQVAMLVPTTILAYQHYMTFRERLEKFPVEIEMLSRFRSTAEQKRIVEKLKNGQIDIVIGTHRLLSKDVAFKDLGLLIIDEEQRFGVRHKERLKRFRATIDILTLTATPIPRTLYLSLMGARDMTNIDTPPKNRLPIVTEILTFNKSFLREVILRELERGGQVFFVHNRIHSIDRVASMISSLIPEAHVAVAHGQMHEKDLEQVMIDFMDRKYQILVSTMIIESGLDMPNVNTIIINRADKFGLAQLYQLRGRVGRSHHRAYAYLLIPPIETLTDEALKRLQAIEEFSELGSGSQLAMRDLEIRGAGNLLGAEQTGFIDALGFDLYNKIVDEAVQELKSEKMPLEETAPHIETQIDIDLDAYLPENYVEIASERVNIYRRLTETKNMEEIDEIRLELVDRFGRLPESVENLLGFVSLRILGAKLGLRNISVNGENVQAVFGPHLLKDDGEPFKKWIGSMVENASRPFEFFQNDGLGIRMKIESIDDNKLLEIRSFLESLLKANKSYSKCLLTK
ncbi:MAG: transcription-repair coupling factor [bacterium]